MYYALAESLNAATASLGLEVGLDNIVDVARRMGVVSKVTALPSLTLGAFELYPWEVVQSYSTIANMGQLIPIKYINFVDNLTGDRVYDTKPAPEARAAAETVAELVGMMKQTFEVGTARGARLSGFTLPAGGKTGTTNDKKDAWFAGFTAHHEAVVWVGYDDNTPHGLTGGGGAVPIWTEYMKSYGATLPPDDFAWPSTVDLASLNAETQAASGLPEPVGDGVRAPLQLVFRKGEAPQSQQPLEPTKNPFHLEH